MNGNSVLFFYFCHFFPTARLGLSLYTMLSVSVSAGLLEHQVIKLVGIGMYKRRHKGLSG